MLDTDGQKSISASFEHLREMRLPPNDCCLRLRAIEAGLYRHAMYNEFTHYEERKLHQAMDKLEAVYQRIEKRLERKSAE